MKKLADIDDKGEGETSTMAGLRHFLLTAVCGIMAVVLVVGYAHTARNLDGGFDPLVAFDFRIAGDENRTRIVIEFEQKPDFSYYLLDTPHRLVVDLPETAFGFQDSAANARGLLLDVRYGAMAPGRSRIVFTSTGPVKVIMADVMESISDGTYKLVLDLAATSAEEFASLINLQRWDRAETPKDGESELNIAPGNDRFKIAIDPGHGGIDTGAKGKGGAIEKDITLAMARELQTLLRENTDIEVFLTREDDSFVSLSERVRRARERAADMFVSIHADSIRVKGVRGATVYTLSEKASDRLALRKATQENRSDLIAGLAIEDEQDAVADILIDLTRRETQVFSESLAGAVIGAFDGSVKLINNPHRSAGFRVLRAPEIPSVLVELGFLSNAEDEKLLIDPKWRSETAKLLAGAVESYRDKVSGIGN
ncbi:MAG: N-acetylmuramoyl-L-alanine amidase [Pseudomonadota bacterium]